MTRLSNSAFLTAAVLSLKAAVLPDTADAQSFSLPASCKGMIYQRDGSLCPALNNYATRGAVAAEDPWALHGIAAPENVAYMGREPANTIIIDRKNDFLYLVLGNGVARKYVIAQGQVGRDMPTDGSYTVFAVRHNPTWRPTKSILARYPDLEDRSYAGGPDNPLGVRAIYLAFGDVSVEDIRAGKYQDSLFRIHGTNQPSKLAKPDGERKVTSGCIRTNNNHVIELARQIEQGMAAGAVYRVIVVKDGLGPDLVRKLGDAGPAIWKPTAPVAFG